MAKVMSINISKCVDLDYINFLIASSTVFSFTEAARCFASEPMLLLMIVLLVSFNSNLQIQNLYGLK